MTCSFGTLLRQSFQSRGRDMRNPRIKLVGIRAPLDEIFDLSASLPGFQYLLYDVNVVVLVDLLKFRLVKLAFYSFASQVFDAVRDWTSGVTDVNDEQLFRPIANVSFLERTSLHRYAYAVAHFVLPSDLLFRL